MKVSKKIYATKNSLTNDNLSVLLEKKYNNIQNEIEIIHVVGTNGKGSVCNYLHKQLRKHKQNVGLFTSPAFLHHNERIKIDDEYISDKTLKRLYKQIKNDIKEYQLNFFEIFTLLCILYFKERNVRFAIIEAGIGGIKDSTKVFRNSKIVALTSIGYDHMEILGDKEEDIIYNKVAVINNSINKDVKLIIANSCKDKLAIIKKYVDSKKILVANRYEDAVNYYQQENAGLVIKILEYLALNVNYEIFKVSPLLGRFTILSKNPYFIIDGAHNPQGIEAFIQSYHMLDIDNDKETAVLYASSKSKNYYENLKILKDEFESNLYITRFRHKLAWDFKTVKFNNKIWNWKKFIDKNKDKNILVCGSLYFIPMVYQYYCKKWRKKW